MMARPPGIGLLIQAASVKSEFAPLLKMELQMLESAQAVQLLADTLERLGAPLELPEDWIILSDSDDLRLMRRQPAKRLLAQAKRETARRWIYERFDPTEMEQELSEERDDDDLAVDVDERLLKQRAINSIDEIVSTIDHLRKLRADFSSDAPHSVAREATVAARVAFGYPEERPSQSDCFDKDVRRQCRRVISEIYAPAEKSLGPVVYVIGTGDPNFVKIGFTTNLKKRLRSLRTASHVEPIVHLAIPGTRSFEQELHTRFASDRHNREWFRLTKKIETFIASEQGKRSSA
jgi:hypothetical protein